jgi:hypothetical protein
MKIILLCAALVSLFATSTVALQPDTVPEGADALDPVDIDVPGPDEAMDNFLGDRTLQDDPSYQVTVQSTSRCTTSRRRLRGRFVVTVKDPKGLKPIQNKEVSLLLVAQDGSDRSYSGEGTTNRRGVVTLPLKSISLEDAGQSLFCSIAIPNPGLPFAQQVPCSFTVATC